ncbi:type IV pilus twitching motility protein PilT [Candidatus Saccharibacteria bacterium]|nr:type IV pilus twitching motility protein PilT [Candidatus Saccharibacteria bacterium]MCB9834663.1 type IV pilus twitching motility protein PilT [Candidatus Nomurabacteria bacterium]
MSPQNFDINFLLGEVVRVQASDLHLQINLPPIIRKHGHLSPISNLDPLDQNTVSSLIFSTLTSDQQQILQTDRELDYSISYGDIARFRVNAFYERSNLAAAFRLIPTKIPVLSELGLPRSVQQFANMTQGLILFTGPTGSGKSTTMAALIDNINTNRTTRIITIEDPVEFVHQNKRSIIAQREVNFDTKSFEKALKSCLREDIDVVLIGEMRDLETIAAAMTIAETGHLVFATLHTNSAAQTIDRIIDVFPADQQGQIRTQLSMILAGIVSQRLVPNNEGKRSLATEVLLATSAISNLIRESKTYQIDSAISTGAAMGMQSMNRSLVDLIRAGKITANQAKDYSINPSELERLMRS